MTERTYTVTIKVEDSADINAVEMIERAMDRASYEASEYVWAECDPKKPWSITVFEDGDVREHFSHEFYPDREEDED